MGWASAWGGRSNANSGMFTIMMGTQGMAAQCLFRAAAAYLSYLLMQTGHYDIATLFLIFSLVVSAQPPPDFEAWVAE